MWEDTFYIFQASWANPSYRYQEWFTDSPLLQKNLCYFWKGGHGKKNRSWRHPPKSIVATMLSTAFLVGGFKYFLFSPLFWEDSHFDQYFSKGLKPPTSFCLRCQCLWTFGSKLYLWNLRVQHWDGSRNHAPADSMTTFFGVQQPMRKQRRGWP